MDVTQLILDDHHEQRRLFAILDEVAAADAGRLRAIWGRLAAFLEVHAAAEEAVFYPELLRAGRGSFADTTPRSETKDAIKDHNEIRDAIAAVGRCAPGSGEWFEAVAKVREANGDHMGEEEREALSDFRRHAPLQLRHELALAFAEFEAAHVTGVAPVDRDPDDYVRHAARA